MRTERQHSMLVRQLPNIITSLRIIGTACLLFIEPFTTPFYIIFTLAGFSDLLDGWIARTMKTTSELGGKLDSIADLTYYTVMILRIFPALLAALPNWVWAAIVLAVGLRIVCYITAAVKYHRFASLHTYMNKVATASIFVVPYVVKTPAAIPYCTFVSVLGCLSSIEELILHLTAKEYTTSRKTILKLK